VPFVSIGGVPLHRRRIQANGNAAIDEFNRQQKL